MARPISVLCIAAVLMFVTLASAGNTILVSTAAQADKIAVNVDEVGCNCPGKCCSWRNMPYCCTADGDGWPLFSTPLKNIAPTKANVPPPMVRAAADQVTRVAGGVGCEDSNCPGVKNCCSWRNMHYCCTADGWPMVR